jgi:class 3 adenylate cyclase/tetratricopeptide (TPR) repeat protein
MSAAVPRICGSCGTENPAEARFCFNCAAPLESAAPPSETRKTVTVLFCDLVGSTAMGEQLDPETLRGLLARSFDRVQAIVESHGGVVEKFIGDAAMAVFGIPRVHEDDALRAVRAAAEIREALAETGDRSGPALAWRTGIATGEVVAGDATGGQRLVTGDAVNVAARLQQTAQPGEILITADTHRLVRDAVEVEPLGEVTVKGRRASIEAVRLVAVDRAAAGHERRLDSPMVGRERPRRLLEDAFREVAETRVCHLFTILGAAGVGKSRLVNEFIGSLGDQATVVRGRCLSYGEGITYWPIGEIVREATSIGSASADPSGDAARIKAVLGDREDADRITALVGEAIGITTGQGTADEIPWAVRSLFEALAAERPLVVVLDDLQWAQPAMLDLVDHIADWSRDAPILLVVLARQELLDLRPAWGGGKRSATSISLEPLDAAETAQLIENLLGRADLPTTIFDRIRAAAEGNPLFVEELLEMLIDDGALTRSNGNWTAGRDLSAISVPPTIQALLAARLDGLAGTERAVLERGAVEGTIFHRDAVAALAPENLQPVVGSSLMALTRREFVAPDRAQLVGREAFRFRHQLIRDAAYQAIAKQARAELHERFADWLEVALGERLDEYRPILAHHLEQAVSYRTELDPADPALPALRERAIEHLVKVGAEAMNRADMRAAANLFRKVAELAAGDDATVLRARLPASEAMIRAVALPEAEAYLLETRALADRLGDERAATLVEALRLHLRAARSEPNDEIVIDAVRLHERLRDLGGDPNAAVRAGMEVAKLYFWKGQAQRALDFAAPLVEAPGINRRLREEIQGWMSAFAFWGPTSTSEALAMVEEMASEGPTSRFLLMRIARHRATLNAMRGDIADTDRFFDEARQIADELGDRLLSASLKGHFEGPARLYQGDPEWAARLEREGYDELFEMGHVGFANTCAAALAWALLELGRDDEAEQWAQTAIEIGDQADPAAAGPAYAVWAIVMARRGRFDEATEKANRSLALYEDSDHIEQIGDIHRAIGEVHRLAGRRDEARAELEAALALYERKEHLVWAEKTRRLLTGLDAERAG